MFSSRLRARAHSRTVTIAALLAVIGLVGPGISSASAADQDVSWAVRTSSNDFGAGRQNYSYTLGPGGKLKDGLVVVNHGKKPLTLKVYAADGFTTGAGQLDLALAAKKPKGVGSWLHTARSSVTVNAGKTVTVPFTVSLPADATPGDHVGGIVTSLAQPDEAEGINVDRRLAVKVRLRVAGDLKPTLAVERLHVDYSGTANPLGSGDATLSYTIHNTGNAILVAKQKASVAGPFGLMRASAEAIDDSPELLPGDTWKVSVPVHGVAPTVALRPQVVLTPIVTDASGTVTPLATVTTTGHGWAIPWSLLVLLVVLAALGFAAVRARKQSRIREEARVEEALELALREREDATHRA